MLDQEPGNMGEFSKLIKYNLESQSIENISEPSWRGLPLFANPCMDKENEIIYIMGITKDLNHTVLVSYNIINNDCFSLIGIPFLHLSKS